MRSSIGLIVIPIMVCTAEAQTGGFSGPGSHGIVSAAEATGLGDDRDVRLKGYIVEAVGDERYRFRDDSGSLLLEIDADVWNGIEATPELEIEVRGEIERSFRRLEVDVDSILPASAASASPVAAAAAVTPAAAGFCSAAGPSRTLPDDARESSGLAASRLRPGVLWTHNDRGNEPLLYAVDGEGRLLESLRLDVPAGDWEDLALGSCPSGSCLYVGDIGDNDGERKRVTIYRLAEPAAGATAAGPVDALHARFPDGPRDAESLFVLPDGDLYLVTKGRREDIALYRYPAPARPGETVTLERVRRLFPEPADGDDRVTAADAMPDGSRVGIRTGTTLYLYAAEALVTGQPIEPAVVDLRPLGERQGEGFAFGAAGDVWLSSEAGNRASAPALNRLVCRLR